MKKIPFFSALVLCAFFLSCIYNPPLVGKCGGMDYHVARQSCDENGNIIDICNYPAIWSGRVDISWYDASQSEFTITTAEAFAGFAALVNGGNNFAGKTIKLGANITLNSTINWQSWAISAPANVWTGIGTSTAQFSGTFDGGGFVISGVYMNSISIEQSFGLFGYVSSSGTIKNLWVTASYIKGKTQVGGLAGYSGGTIINSYFSGTVIGTEKVGGLVGSITGSSTIKFSYSVGTVTGERYVGGLVGYSASSLLSNGNILVSSIISSYSTSVVIGTGMGSEVGGLVGGNWGIIISSYFSGTVTGLVSVGGLVGDNNGGSVIDSSYSLGTVKGKENVGGFVGFNGGGKINFSYSEMMVTGTEYIGGFVGQSSIEGIISNSYSTGTVVGERYVGGFIGWNHGTISYSYSIGIVAGVSFTGGFAGIEKGKITYCYYNKETSRQNDTGKGEGKTTAEMKLRATFGGWDFANIWSITTAINNGYPYLRVFYPPVNDCPVPSVWNGTVDTTWYANNKNESEFTICAAEQLAGLAELVNGGNNFVGKTVKLGENIMLNDTANWKNWASSAPINKWTKIGTNIRQFNGTFDGKNFVIGGVYINSTSDDQGFGLFGYVDSKGTIKDLGVTASYIKAGTQVGGIAGSIKNIVSNSYFIGTVAGKSTVGGLVGNNSGTVSNSHSAGTATGETFVGGFVGSNSNGGVIGNSYSTSKVEGTIEVGGFAGRNSNSARSDGTVGYSLISDSYSTGDVKGKAQVGGFVGGNFGTVNSSHSNGKVTGENQVGGFVGDSNGGSVINNSYSTGMAEGKNTIGGLAGFNVGAISNSYSIGAVTGTEYSIGGFAGQNQGSISNSYSIGKTGGAKDRIGGFVGWHISGGTIGNCYYNKEASGQSDTGKGEGKTTAEMKKKEIFVDWDFAKTWDINATINSGYPYLREIPLK